MLQSHVAQCMRKKRIPEATMERMLSEIRFPAKPKLLGSSRKVEKGEKQGVLTAVLYLAPHELSKPWGGGNVCPHATPGCIAACLGHSSGRLRLESSRNSQVWKTLVFLHARTVFSTMLETEIHAHVKKAKRKGLTPALRLDGTSDTALGEFWSKAFPEVQFYDYTKSRSKALRWAQGDMPATYHVTFSLAETKASRMDADAVAAAGGNVAVVFRTRDPAEFPKKFIGLPVINGDETDIRFGDPRGCVVGLTAKGSLAPKDTTGFVQEVK